ncbi:MAG: class I SAM-dependent methyltransferase [Candidatus Sericytochromatia bacterium]
MTDLELLEWSFHNVSTHSNLPQTVDALNQALVSPPADLRHSGLMHYYLASALVSTQDYRQAWLHFSTAVTALDGDAPLLLVALKAYIDFMEQLDMLEFTLKLVESGLKRFPDDAGLQAKAQQIGHQMQGVPYAESSNLKHWQQMQETGYFDAHAHYQTNQGLLQGGSDLDLIARYTQLEPSDKVAVIGCGYGRETLLIAPLVEKIWGIDVNAKILTQASDFLSERGIGNFVPVLAEHWHADIPDDLDLAYAYTVFQHLTKHLVEDYVLGMAQKLRPGGNLVCQFMHSHTGTHDAALTNYEPHVSWTRPEIDKLAAKAGLELASLDEQLVVEDEQIFWYILHARKALSLLALAGAYLPYMVY